MKNETIVDRVVERLKLQPLGDLITEEDLHDIVKQAIPKAFFEKRTEVVHSSYRSETIYKDPLILEIMRELLKETVKKSVDEWIKEHNDELLSNWKVVMDKGIFQYVNEIQNYQATEHVRGILRELVSKLNSERSARGELQLQTFF
jgi:hypothetical protein